MTCWMQICIVCHPVGRYLQILYMLENGFVNNIQFTHPQGFVATFKSLVTFVSKNKPLFLCFFVFKTKLRAFVSLCLKSKTIRIIRKSVAY